MKAAQMMLMSLLVCLSLAGLGFAQTSQAETASISGRVTVEGAARAGVSLLLQSTLSESAGLYELAPPLTAQTDAEGRFAFQQVPVGQYRLQPYAPVWVSEEARDLLGEGRLLNLAAGETLTEVNFALRRGGVITGKVVDETGRPFIEEPVILYRLDAASEKPQQLTLRLAPKTDDRGVYRIFGLRPGSYRVAVEPAQTERAVLGLSQERQRTYFPEATTEAEAKLVEVQSGGVAEGIDIVVRLTAAKKGWTISGRVLEAETGKPVAGLTPTYSRKYPKAGELARARGPAPTNSLGEFRLEGLAAGEYSLHVMDMQALTGGAEFYAEPLEVTLPEHDVSGVELKLKRGATLQGRLVMESGGDPKFLGQLTGNHLSVYPEEAWADPANGASIMFFITAGTVRADATFNLIGLRPGRYQLSWSSQENDALKLLRIEQNGVPVTRIEIPETAKTVSVQLVMGLASATLTGRIEVRNGSLPPGAKIRLLLLPRDSANTAQTALLIFADDRGLFSFQGVVPGSYYIGVGYVQAPDGSTLIDSGQPRQPVTLTANSRQDIVFVIDLAAKEKQQ